LQPSPNWKEILEARLPLFGHRNWLVLADSAYPFQSSAGIETIVSNEAQQAIVDYLLASLRAYQHIRPIFHAHSEIKFVDEAASSHRALQRGVGAPTNSPGIA
jgi:hypothetical protein